MRGVIMDAMVDIITKLGFPIAVCLALGLVFYKIIIRIMDENKEREQANRESQEKLTQGLNEVAKTIEKSNDVNQELSNTNRILVDKIEGDLVGIKSTLDSINNKLEK